MALAHSRTQLLLSLQAVPDTDISSIELSKQCNTTCSRTVKVQFSSVFWTQVKAVYLLDTWAGSGLQSAAQGSIPLQLRNGLSALRVLRIIRLLRVVRFIHARLLP